MYINIYLLFIYPLYPCLKGANHWHTMGNNEMAYDGFPESVLGICTTYLCIYIYMCHVNIYIYVYVIYIYIFIMYILPILGPPQFCLLDIMSPHGTSETNIHQFIQSLAWFKNNLPIYRNYQNI